MENKVFYFPPLTEIVEIVGGRAMLYSSSGDSGFGYLPLTGNNNDDNDWVSLF